MRSLLLMAALLSSDTSGDDNKCTVTPTCTITITAEGLPFTPPEPGVWLMYTLSGGAEECGLHWSGVWNVTGPNGNELFWTYRRPWNAMCGPNCAEAYPRGQYLHLPNTNTPGTYKVEVHSDKGGGWDAKCVEVVK